MARPAGSRELDRAVSAVPGSHRCLVMGVVNVTPDSFSDGGRYLAVDAAVEHGLRMAQQGADLVDVGGESTRPGAGRTPASAERARVLPVVRELAAAGVAVSIDTMRATVAEAAVDAGAVLVNDVSGGLADPGMARCVAELGTPYIAMHWRAHSARMREHSHYRDVVADVLAELRGRVDALVTEGVRPDRVIVDPGLGFAKTADQTWQLVQRFEELSVLGRHVLVGASRKSFLTAVAPRSAADGASREAATTAVTTAVAARGAFAVRVHDVPASVVAARVGELLRRRPLPVT
ncbi:dihydropteroate synthase [Amycolatopsis thermoflava]|uniref:Dihydropteroate synthase n=1 Tax=Amycolatopsis thermoflava TaxID=84480 RepID=A0A3N2H5X7_9PSEU|nr:dihydropteroate synthase [Amycolatopsis thermoflava]ROS44317.1 dihydropteroate synthase [Amycolatopsis thermoflava]